MKMIGPQHRCIEPCTTFALRLSHAVQEHLIILLLKDDGLPIVPALDDMMGIGRETEPRWTRQGREPSQTNEQENLCPDQAAVDEMIL